MKRELDGRLNIRYCLRPNESDFFNFLSSQHFTSTELMQLKLMHIDQICVDDTGAQWEVHFACAAHLTDNLLKVAAAKLAAAFSLQHVDMICDGNGHVCSLPAMKVEPDVEIDDCSGEPVPDKGISDSIRIPPDGLHDSWEGPPTNYGPTEQFIESNYQDLSPFASNEDIPLPDIPEQYEDSQPDELLNDAEYLKAVENAFGEKKEDDLLWGKKIRGAVRKIESLTEEENRVVIEGTFVKTLDKDSELQAFDEREFKTGTINLKFSMSDDTGGIYVKLRFLKKEENSRYKSGYDDPRKACNEFKSKLKPGMRLRIQGNVKPDNFEFNEMVMTPSGIMKAESEQRMDHAENKRVELHCHTKMSKLDGVTPMQELVQQAHNWGHKALAITDHGVVQAFPFCYDEVMDLKSDLKLIFGMEGYLIADRKTQGKEIDQEAGDPTKVNKRAPKIRSHHIIILAKNEIGLRNLYKLVTISHMRYFNRSPLLPREVIEEHREGLILGSACEAGELYRAILSGASDEELEDIANFYDYLEIQPTGNNMFLVRQHGYSVKDLEEHNRKIYELGKKLGKLVVATCDVHFLNPEDAKYRAILQAGQHYSDADQQPPLFLHTTEEMLDEFAYLGKEAAYEVVVENTNRVAEMVERIKPVPDRDQLYSPSIPGAEDAVRDMSYAKAHEWYGETLPQVVEDRLKFELDSIIGNGFSVLYFIAHKLVKHSLDRGYLVGSRGSVGSSFVATMLEITEVNALPPHYRCPKCKHSEFFLHNEYDSGFDLPNKDCPECGTRMIRDGHEIPFAVFLGFHGDKVPDIDLNFSGGIDPDDPDSMSDQSVAHKYTEELFGRDNVCRAGTLATIANKTAVGFIRKYYEDKGIHPHPALVSALVGGLAGVKRTTGQHPGGIMVIPRNMDIHYITPMNRPADDKDGDTITTHYDYHSINDRLVKLDILGHDDPMVLKMLEKYLQETFDPHFNPKDIPVGDEETMRIFQDTSSLGVTPAQIYSNVGTFGIPECGTQFVRQMIEDVKPKNFSQVVRVSGYSHGTDVWLNNAQDLIREGKPVDETISTRDDIMTHLISKGVEPSLAFKTMEYVRKGKAAKKGLEPQMREAMVAANIPEWYMTSCERVQYLFPKAHAVAYVLMAYRIAYCKVHHPKEFYAAYFTVRAKDFEYGEVAKGRNYIRNFIEMVDNVELDEETGLIVSKSTRAESPTKRGEPPTVLDKSTATYLEMANEMMERGFIFEKMDIYESDALKFKVTDKGLRPPLASLAGVGDTAAKAIAAVVDKNNPFISQEDLRQRAGVGKSVIEKLAAVGALGDMPETNQIDLFSFA